jgi:hypothetical protein
MYVTAEYWQQHQPAPYLYQTSLSPFLKQALHELGKTDVIQSRIKQQTKTCNFNYTAPP